jgi:hypothetical protein
VRESRHLSTAQGNGLNQGASPAAGESHAFLLQPTRQRGDAVRGEAKREATGQSRCARYRSQFDNQEVVQHTASQSDSQAEAETRKGWRDLPSTCCRLQPAVISAGSPCLAMDIRNISPWLALGPLALMAYLARMAHAPCSCLLPGSTPTEPLLATSGDQGPC